MSIYYNLLFLFLFQLFFIFFFKYVAFKVNLLDFPDSRKRHQGNIPLTGGLSIYFPVLLSLFLIDIQLEILIIYLTSFIVLIVGVFDDKFNLGVISRFFFQIVSVLIVIGFGIYISNLGNLFGLSSTYFSGLGIVFTFLCVIGFTNSINFVDGLDGLASGLIINTLLSIYFFSYLDNEYMNSNLHIIIFLILTTSVFFFANFGIIFPKIFLGDSGSTFLGFVTGFLLIYYTQINKNFHPVLAVWATSIPTFDFISVFFRRILKRINPFKPDRRHLHFILISIGYKPSFISLTIIILAIILSSIGFLSYKYLGPIQSFVIYFLFLIMYIIITIKLGRRFYKI